MPNWDGDGSGTSGFGGSGGGYGTDTYDTDYGGPNISEGWGGANPGWDPNYDPFGGKAQYQANQWNNFKNVMSVVGPAIWGGTLGRILGAKKAKDIVANGGSITKNVDAALKTAGYSPEQISAIKASVSKEVAQATKSANIQGDYNPQLFGGAEAGQAVPFGEGSGQFGAGGEAGGISGGSPTGDANLDKMWTDYESWLSGPGTIGVQMPGFMGGANIPILRRRMAEAKYKTTDKRAQLPIELEKLRLEERRIDEGVENSKRSNEKDYLGAAAVALPSVLEEITSWF